MKYLSQNVLLACRAFGLMLVLLVAAAINPASAQDGEKLFKANCASCHKVDQNMTGPALKGAEGRWAGRKELLYQWIQNPAKVKDMGDPYVNKLLAEWEPKAGLMTAQAVSNEEIDAILTYVRDWTPPVQAGPAPVPGAAPVDDGVPLSWLLIILFILLILVFSLWGVNSSLTKINKSALEDEGIEASDAPVSVKLRSWAWDNKLLVSVLSILVVVYLAVGGYEALMGVGVYQGYTPEQPIKFNHTLHAGTNQVACVYCHHSALKSKHAGIPSANICMNCHKAINQGKSEEGTADIMKIYAAVGWDQENQRYTGEEKPIKWVKVHNLPDHAYFNHAQHYVVGQIECQECHGQIQAEYTVAGQHSPLTMGWCIDCHNKTAVNMAGNGYYDEVHKRLVDHGKDELKKYLEDGSITARELGGWECAKCHY